MRPSAADCLSLPFFFGRPSPRNSSTMHLDFRSAPKVISAGPERDPDIPSGLAPAAARLCHLKLRPELGLVEAELTERLSDFGTGVFLQLHGEWPGYSEVHTLTSAMATCRARKMGITQSGGHHVRPAAPLPSRRLGHRPIVADHGEVWSGGIGIDQADANEHLGTANLPASGRTSKIEVTPA